MRKSETGVIPDAHRSVAAPHHSIWPSARLSPGKRLNESTLAVLLDACPHLKKLILDTQSLPYDVLR